MNRIEEISIDDQCNTLEVVYHILKTYTDTNLNYKYKQLWEHHKQKKLQRKNSNKNESTNKTGKVCKNGANHTIRAYPYRHFGQRYESHPVPRC